MRSMNAMVAMALGLALSGCGLFDGADPCDKADGAANNVASKSGSCSGVTPPAIAGREQCDSAISQCNEAEKAILDEEVACLSNIGPCVSGKEDEFLQDIAECLAPVAALGAGCRQGFGL